MLVRDPEANHLHEIGLQAEISSAFDLAHDLFNDAMDALGTPDGESDTLDQMVQWARIKRDDGFTYIREAIKKEEPRLLEEAGDNLYGANEMLAPFAGGVEYLVDQQTRLFMTPKSIRRELFAESGETLSCLGRLATVVAVVDGKDTRGLTDKAIVARNVDQAKYGHAHDLLRVGSNGYYRVSNAMVGARQEVLNGRDENASLWLGRATNGLIWTLTHDQGNRTAALRTAASRVRHLRSYDAALVSVLTHP